MRIHLLSRLLARVPCSLHPPHYPFWRLPNTLFLQSALQYLPDCPLPTGTSTISFYSNYTKLLAISEILIFYASTPFLTVPSVWNVLFLISVLGSFLSRFMSQLKYCLLQETFCAHNLVRILHGADTVTLLFILFLLLITSRKHHMYLLHLHH